MRNTIKKTYNGFKVGDFVKVSSAKNSQIYEINRIWDQFLVELVYECDGEIVRGGNIDASSLKAAV